MASECDSLGVRYEPRYLIPAFHELVHVKNDFSVYRTRLQELLDADKSGVGLVQE